MILSAGPLRDLRVLEFSREVAAAYCGRQFATWGADVVVVEPPGGSPLRRLHPIATGRDGEPVSLVWTNVAAGKRTLSPPGTDAATIRALLAGADVFITDHDPAALGELGLPLDALRRDYPRLCIVALSPFGLDGPYSRHRGGDLIVQALSGYLGLNGLVGEPPLQAPGRLTAYATGVNAFVGALAAYLKRVRTGRGDLVEVSGLETLASIVPYLRVQYLGGDKHREGGTEAGVRILPCADGWISLMPNSVLHKPVLADVLNIPDEAFPPDLLDGDYSTVVRRTMGFYSAYTRRMSADDLFLALEERGVTCGKVMAPEELLALPQLRERDFFKAMAHPALGAVDLPGPAARLSESATAAPQPDAPVSATELGWSPREAAPTEKATDTLPLAGVRVLDLTQAWIGPFATLIFADLGADVIKIESHRRPDVWRQTSPHPLAITDVHAEFVNRSHYFNSVNRNKRNLTLDLRSEDGKRLFLALVRDADVVAENYTSRVMDRFGLGYAALAAVKPDIVMMSSSGFGKTGPWRDFKTNGSAIEALAGWDWLHRYRGGPPILMGFYQADAICGLQMAALTLVSLVHKNRTGRGQSIDGSMLEASAGYLGEVFLAAQLGEPVQAQGNRHPDMAPHGVFPVAGADRWIAIAAPDDAAWRALAALTGGEGCAADPRFATLAGRLADQDALEGWLAAWTRDQDADALMDRLQRAGVPAGVVRTAAEGLTEPQLAARRWFKDMTHPDLGTHKYNGFPWRFADCELVAHTPPPRLGEHSDLLLRERLSLSDDEIAELKRKDVTGTVF